MATNIHMVIRGKSDLKSVRHFGIHIGSTPLGHILESDTICWGE